MHLILKGYFCLSRGKRGQYLAILPFFAVFRVFLHSEGVFIPKKINWDMLKNVS